MGTANFYNKNASKIYAVEIEDEIDYDDLFLNTQSALETLAKKKGYYFIPDSECDGGGNWQTDRNFPPSPIGKIESKTKDYMGIECRVDLCVVSRGGYYSGANLDWEIEYICDDSYEEIDDIDFDDYFEGRAKQYKKWITKFLEEQADQLIEDVEGVLEEVTNPLVVTAQFSSGETWYGKEGEDLNPLRGMAKGGLTKGKSHKEGGIPMTVKSTGQKIEVEGGEGIVNKHSMSSDKKYEYEGKEKTTCEIVSDLNQKEGDGVGFSCDTVESKKYKFMKGGKTKKDKLKIHVEKISDDRKNVNWYDGKIASRGKYELWAHGDTTILNQDGDYLDKDEFNNDKDLDKVGWDEEGDMYFEDSKWFELVDTETNEGYDEAIDSDDYEEAIKEFDSHTKDGFDPENYAKGGKIKNKGFFIAIDRGGDSLTLFQTGANVSWDDLTLQPLEASKIIQKSLGRDISDDQMVEIIKVKSLKEIDPKKMSKKDFPNNVYVVIASLPPNENYKYGIQQWVTLSDHNAGGFEWSEEAIESMYEEFKEEGDEPRFYALSLDIGGKDSYVLQEGEEGDSEYYKKGGLTPQKAKQILEDGEANGKPLTNKQKRYFGWIAGGSRGKYKKGGKTDWQIENYWNEGEVKDKDYYHGYNIEIWGKQPEEGDSEDRIVGFEDKYSDAMKVLNEEHKDLKEGEDIVIRLSEYRDYTKDYGEEIRYTRHYKEDKDYAKGGDTSKAITHVDIEEKIDYERWTHPIIFGIKDEGRLGFYTAIRDAEEEVDGVTKTIFYISNGAYDEPQDGVIYIDDLMENHSGSNQPLAVYTDAFDIVPVTDIKKTTKDMRLSEMVDGDYEMQIEGTEYDSLIPKGTPYLFVDYDKYFGEYKSGGEVNSYMVYDLRDMLINAGDDDFVLFEEEQSGNTFDRETEGYANETKAFTELYHTFKDRLEDYHGEEVYAKGGLLKGITDGEPIKERQVVLLKNRWTKGVRDKETTEAMDYVNSNEVMITPEQTKKGLDFLKNLWKTPTGKERKNNPFGYREQKALETFEYFTLDRFKNLGTGYDWYVPVYTVHGDTGYFTYYYDGKVNIIAEKGKQLGHGGEVDGSYGSARTPSTIYYYEDRKGGTWYVAEGSVNVNYTYDSVDNGVNIETLSDVDMFTSGKPIESSEQLEDMLMEDGIWEKGGKIKDKSYKKGGKTEFGE